MFSSFGKDSLLLLYLIKERIDNFHTIWYKTDLIASQKKFCEKIIMEWNLTVYSYPPADKYFLRNPESGELIIINEYSIGGFRFPVLSQPVHDDKQCSLDLSKQRLEFFRFPFDVALVGWKNCDSHWLTGPNPFPDNGSEFAGDGKVYAPLRYLTDAQVESISEALNIPRNLSRYVLEDAAYDPDSTLCCTKCFEGEKRVYCPKIHDMITAPNWDPEPAVTAFRERFMPEYQSPLTSN